MQVTAQELCAYLNGKLEGNPNVKVDRPSKIEEGQTGTISFIASPKYEDYAYTTQASVLLVSHDFKPDKPIEATLIRVENVYECLTTLLEKFGGNSYSEQGINQLSFVHSKATIGSNVSIGAFAFIDEGVEIGNDSMIYPQVFLGKNVKVGKNVTLHPGVRIYHDCEVGDNTTIHSNTVIGSDGFGFMPKGDGTFKKVPQIGNVKIGNHVEIGSNNVIDRATMGSTIIKDGVKLDNLIQIAHNVEVGKNTVIAAQAGIAGSTKLGENCMVGGQAGFVGHINVAEGSKIQAQSGVSKSIDEPYQAWHGSPAFKYGSFMRSQVVFQRLPELMKRIDELEAQLAKLQKENNGK